LTHQQWHKSRWNSGGRRCVSGRLDRARGGLWGEGTLPH